ncbi:MAG TPA: tetratricopeptide repeat protein [Vicinamibacteria bacterium]|jgi:Flp pilus assembly protein TadD|nr:tetratricopeptide repeat protein [Vicinamibacteria bacterium]
MNPFRKRLLHRTALVLFLAVGLAGAAAAQADPESRFAAGLMHLREGRADMAIDEFKKAIKLDPKNPYFYKGLGQALAQKQKFADATEAFKKALELNPYYTDVRNDLGSALILAGNREEGKKEFLAAFNDPTNPTPEISARNLGEAFLEEKNYGEAANWFRTSVNRHKSYADPYLGLADALVGLGRVEEAIAQLEIGAKEAPENPGLLLSLGQLYNRVGRFKEARTCLEGALKKDPGGPSGRRAGELLKELPK